MLTLAVVTKRSLPGFQSIKISKFLSKANTKVNVTCITYSLHINLQRNNKIVLSETW